MASEQEEVRWKNILIPFTLPLTPYPLPLILSISRRTSLGEIGQENPILTLTPIPSEDPTLPLAYLTSLPSSLSLTLTSPFALYLRIGVSFYQLLSAFQWFEGANPYPYPFDPFLTLISFLNLRVLDGLGIECWGIGVNINFFDNLLFVTLTPIVLASFIWGGYLLCCYKVS